MAIKTDMVSRRFGVWKSENTDANATAQKDLFSGPCRLTSMYIDNLGSGTPTDVYVKFYDNRNPTVGGTAPCFIVEVPASKHRTYLFMEWDANGKLEGGVSFPIGLSYAVTKEGGTAGTSNPDTAAQVWLGLTAL